MTKKLTDYKQQNQNANRHTERGMRLLEKSIQEDGWIGAITAAADGEIFDGSARHEVGTSTGFDAVEPIVIRSRGDRPIIHIREDIPSADHPLAKKLGIAANRVASLNLEWEPDVLAALANEVDLSSLFTTDELADLAQPLAIEAGGGGDDFDVEGALEEETRVKPGELWVIGGKHRLVCGDCTDPTTVSLLMGDDKPVLMVTDPPYGVEYDPNWRNEAAAAGHLAYAARRVGQVSNDDRSDWTPAWELFPGDVVYCWHDGRRASSVQASLEAAGFEIRCQVVWAKSNFPIGRGHYHWRHEPCWYAVRKGATGHWIGDHKQTTLWEINLDRNVDGGHSTQKPLECMARPIRNHEAEIVYDPFLGSGTTLIAAHRQGRRCFGLEIEPSYCEAILRRAEAEGLTVERA